MELQRVLAHDTRKAMEKVYELYGEDAMVVSNKKAQNQTELIVAIDLATQAMDALGDSPSESAPVRRGALGDMPNFDSVLESHVYGDSEVPRVQTAKVSPIAAAQNRIKPFEQGVEINPNFATSKPADAPSTDDNGNLRALEIVDMVKQELASMRKEF